MRTTRKPWVAAVFSVLLPGLGHLYVGRGTAAMLWFPFVVVAPFVATAAIAWLPFGGLNLLLGLGAPVAILLGIIVQATVAARRTPEDFIPRPYNRWYVYIGLIIGIGLSADWARETTKRQLLQAYHVPSAAMEPTLLVGDFIYVSRLGGSTRGSIVVYDAPNEPGIEVVKRVLGMSGDTLEMIGNVLRRNGRPVDEPYVIETDGGTDRTDPQFRAWQLAYVIEGNRESYTPTLKNWGPLVVPAGSLFVLGDNRDNSYDSRYTGFVSEDAVNGRPIVVYYSYERDGPLPMPFVTGVRWDRVGLRFP